MAIPEPQSHNVTELEQWLSDTLDEINEADEKLHQIRDQVRRRLYALRVAADPSLANSVHYIEKLIDAEEPVETLSGPEFEKRFRELQDQS
jgi:hypothetical protein